MYVKFEYILRSAFVVDKKWGNRLEPAREVFPPSTKHFVKVSTVLSASHAKANPPNSPTTSPPNNAKLDHRSLHRKANTWGNESGILL